MDLSEYDDVLASDEAVVNHEDSRNYVFSQLQLTPHELDKDGKPVFKSMDMAVKTFIECRNALSAYRSNFNLVEEIAKEEMDKISMWLRDRGDELGVDSVKTQYGTAFRNVKTFYRVGDWDQFIKWVSNTGNFQCLEKRVAKLATKEIHDDTGNIPPGISYSAEVCFDVRSPTKKKA